MRMERFSRQILFFLFILNIVLLQVWGQDKVRIKIENGVQVIMNLEKPSSPPGSPTQMGITKELVIGKLKKMRMGINISYDIKSSGSKLSLLAYK